jgi:hypothetical protein
MRRIVMIAFVFPTMSVVCAYAQQCLYGPGETPARLTVVGLIRFRGQVKCVD